MISFSIDKRIKEPLYKQIIRHLENQILTGTLKDGDLLPSIEDFSSYIEVSQIVIRGAYRALEEKGLIEKIIGKGTFVKSRPKVVIPFREFYEINYFFADIHEHVKRILQFIKVENDYTYIKTTCTIYGYPYYIQNAKLKGVYSQDLQELLDEPESIYEVFFKLIGSLEFNLQSYFYSRKADTFNAYLLDIHFNDPVFYILTNIKNEHQEDLASVETIFPSNFVSFEASI